MPLYEYIADGDEDHPGCRICSKGFEIRRPITRPPLEFCPICKTPVKKLISKNVSAPKVSAPLSVSDAKKAGFTVLEKRETGVYEKL